MLFSRFLFCQTLKKIEMEFHGFIVPVNDENKFAQLLNKRRFNFKILLWFLQNWCTKLRVASQHNKVGNILCQQLATFNWLQHQFLAKKKVSQLCHRMLISQSFNFPIFFRGARPQTLLRGVLQSNMPHWLISEWQRKNPRCPS